MGASRRVPFRRHVHRYRRPARADDLTRHAQRRDVPDLEALQAKPGRRHEAVTEPRNNGLDDLPDGLPQTASPKDPVPWWPVILSAVLGMLVISLLTVSAWRTLGSHPGEEMNADGVDGVVVSAEKSKYLPPDIERFGVRP